MNINILNVKIKINIDQSTPENIRIAENNSRIQNTV